MIRKGDLPDIAPLILVTKACAEHMISQGIYQWNAHYPSPSAFKNDVARQELYVLELGEEIKGSIVLSTKKDLEYEPISWLSNTEHNLYIHRLAVHPTLQGRGYAQKFMDFAENYARKRGFESIRLDTFSQNPRNQRFYEQRGYQRLGNIFFPKQSDHPFYCYELLL